MFRAAWTAGLIIALCGGMGCAMSRPMTACEPLFIPTDNQRAVWEQTVEVVHEYFEIASENQEAGVIEFQPKVGAGVLEPWHKDSYGLENRVESTLQSIRRRGVVNITQTDGGHLVNVEVYKELEDVPGGGGSSAGDATFQQTNPIRRDLELVGDRATAPGWLSRGRDYILEQEMMLALRRRFSR